jgi:hypothetical protein
VREIQNLKQQETSPMRIATLIAGATLALGMMAAAAPSQALPGLPQISDAGKLTVQIADYDDRGRYEGRRRFSDDRRSYGYGGDEHRGRHWRHRGYRFDACRSVRRDCADDFDWGSWRFRRCLRRSGC